MTQSKIFDQNLRISKFDQNSVSHFLFLASNTLIQSRLSLISLRKNTSSKQDLHCKYWLGLVFLRSEIRESKVGVRYWKPKIKSVTLNFGQTLEYILKN